MSVSKMEIHLNAIFSVQERDRPYVGLCSFDNLQCNKSHYRLNKCRGCRWNACQGCGDPNVPCPACGLMLCDASCIYYGEIPFRGWTSWCHACIGRGERRICDIPQEWKNVYEVQAVPQVQAGADVPPAVTPIDDPPAADPPVGIPADVIVIEDETPEKTWLDRIKEEFPLLEPDWDVFPDKDVRAFLEQEIYDKDTPLQPRYTVEMQKLVNNLVEHREACQQLAEDPPDPFFNARDPMFWIIEKVFRNQDYPRFRKYQLAKEEMEILNAKRVVKADKIEVIAYHGTSQSSAKSIGRIGPVTKRNKRSRCGWGFYVGMENLGIATHYAFDRLFGEKPAMVVGYMLKGLNCKTEAGMDLPHEGYDSGGYGNDWIGVSFHNENFYPKYTLFIREASEEEWELQVDSILHPGKPSSSGKNRMIYDPYSPRPSYSPTSPTYGPAFGGASGMVPISMLGPSLFGAAYLGGAASGASSSLAGAAYGASSSLAGAASGASSSLAGAASGASSSLAGAASGASSSLAGACSSGAGASRASSKKKRRSLKMRFTAKRKPLAVPQPVPQAAPGSPAASPDPGSPAASPPSSCPSSDSDDSTWTPGSKRT